MAFGFGKSHLACESHLASRDVARPMRHGAILHSPHNTERSGAYPSMSAAASVDPPPRGVSSISKLRIQAPEYNLFGDAITSA